jgi:FMN hydrolase / 5-amino-6-(5-phospho-D-ribitylamino)uracil phosphatase
LKERFSLAVVTNGIDGVQRSRLRAARIDVFFRIVVTSEGCGFAKPDPRIVGVALDALGVAPRQALFVGDDIRVDGEAARRAGVRFVWMNRGNPVAPGMRRPRTFITRLSELPAVL